MKRNVAPVPGGRLAGLTRAALAFERGQRERVEESGSRESARVHSAAEQLVFAERLIAELKATNDRLRASNRVLELRAAAAEHASAGAIARAYSFALGAGGRR